MVNMETECPNCGSEMIKAPCDFATYLAACVGAKALECPRCGHREMKYREIVIS
ncbi:MAG: hypothetical protein GTO23_01390 [Nitrososphaeria archaeon]|nr:hypothetical protein [Nitrososphaeria archaeon]